MGEGIYLTGSGQSVNDHPDSVITEVLQEETGFNWDYEEIESVWSWEEKDFEDYLEKVGDYDYAAGYSAGGFLVAYRQCEYGDLEHGISVDPPSGLRLDGEPYRFDTSQDRDITVIWASETVENGLNWGSDQNRIIEDSDHYFLDECSRELEDVLESTFRDNFQVSRVLSD